MSFWWSYYAHISFTIRYVLHVVGDKTHTARSLGSIFALMDTRFRAHTASHHGNQYGHRVLMAICRSQIPGSVPFRRSWGMSGSSGYADADFDAKLGLTYTLDCPDFCS